MNGWYIVSSFPTEIIPTEVTGIDIKVTHIGKVPVDSGGGHHRGAHQMGPAACPLAPFEVPVGAGSATLARRQHVVVHGETQRAARLAPFEPGVEENAIETFRLRLPPNLAGPWNDHGPYTRSDASATENASGVAQVIDPGVGARVISTHIGVRIGAVQGGQSRMIGLICPLILRPSAEN